MFPLFFFWARVVVAADPVSQPRIHFGGFADVELHTSSDNVREGLDLAEIDLFSTATLSRSWSALADVVAQSEWRKQEGGDRGVVELDLERLYATYSASDAFSLEIGQTHTGIIRWNEREHHSRILQTPIDVPAIARRPQENGAWPLRFVGIWVSGRTAGPLGLAWEAGAGAGPGSARDVIPLLSSDRSPAAFMSLSASPDVVTGLNFGLSVYAQHVPAKPDAFRERDLTASLNYVNRGTEVRAEWARMNHTLTRGSKSFRTTGYYALFSQRLPGLAERARPYLLLDRLFVAPGETYLSEVTPENAWAAGVRYDVNRQFSVKGEYRSQRAPNGDREALLGMQFGLSF